MNIFPIVLTSLIAVVGGSLHLQLSDFMKLMDVRLEDREVVWETSVCGGSEVLRVHHGYESSKVTVEIGVPAPRQDVVTCGVGGTALRRHELNHSFLQEGEELSELAVWVRIGSFERKIGRIREF